MDMAGAAENVGTVCEIRNNSGRSCVLSAVSHADARSAEFVRDWEALVTSAAEPNPFFEPWFLLPSLDAFVSPRGAVQLLTVRASGALVGLIPIKRYSRYYGHVLPHFATWLHPNAFFGAPLVAGGYETAFWETLFEYLDKAGGTGLFLHLPTLPTDGPLHAALGEICGVQGRQIERVMTQERALLSSDLMPQAYLEQSLSKKHRKELRRQRRRLAELGDLDVEVREDENAIREWIAQYLDLEAAGWKGDSGTALASSPRSRRFFTEAMHGAAEAGCLQRIALHLDGKPIAMLATLITKSGAFSFKTAFDETYAAHSPGMQLQIAYLDVLTRKDIPWTDSCAASGHPMIERLWTERRTLVHNNVAIGGTARRAIFRGLVGYETGKRKAA